METGIGNENDRKKNLANLIRGIGHKNTHIKNDKANKVKGIEKHTEGSDYFLVLI